MKKRKNRLCLLLAVLLAAGSITVLPVSAGSSTIKMDGESCKEELDSSVWHDADGDLLTENSAVIFPDDSTESTKLISTSDVVRASQIDTMLNAKFTLNFTSLPEGESFVFGMGLSSLEACIGEEGNLEIAFTNNGGLKVQAVAYETSDTPTALMEAALCGGIGDAVSAEVVLTTSGLMTLKVNGNTICQADVPVTGEGSVGFLQTGSCGAKLTDMDIRLYQYDRPENCDVFEDFEAGDFNLNLFSSRMKMSSKYSPSSLAVEEYNGNHVLMFKNVAKGYLITKYQYSNFELTFDMPYLQTADEKNEAGEIITPRFSSFGVSFGSDVGGNDTYAEVDNIDFVDATELLLFMGDGVIGWNTNHPVNYAKNHDYDSEDCDQTPTFRISVIDGVVTVQVKWTEEPDSAYETMMSYTLDATPTGYIALWAPSEMVTSFAIDNLRIRNMDKDPNLIEVDKKSSKWVIPEDYQYQPMEKEYREITEKESKDRWYLPIVIVAGGCILAIGVTVGVTVAKKKKNGRKEGAEHEE